MSLLWGIDLGGTKIEGVVLGDDGPTNPLARVRIDTEADGGYTHIVSRIAALLRELEGAVGAKPNAVGVGTPGSRNPATGLMRNCNTTCLNGQPLLDDLIAALGMPVVLANDADCFALAEAKWGAGRGYSSVFGVIMGTGVGGGLVVNELLIKGANGIAGEWGHNVLDPDGPLCYCGKRGCVETFLSGPANEREFASRTGRSERLREIVELASSGDAEASTQVELLFRRFGQAIAVVINIIDPHVIVLGGGVGQVPGLLTFGREATRSWVFCDAFETPFRLPELGDSAGVFGAAQLVADPVSTTR
ncbi:MAG TPA: ROK family protein [Fimbriimonadaceae bacterium]|nr:ROK family protein [Fimbriimonadaceae bacterium]